MGHRGLFPALLAVSQLVLFSAAGSGRQDRRPDDRFASKPKAGPLPADELKAKDPSQETMPVWVFFTDKGPAGARSLETDLVRAEKGMDPRCLWRRSKVLPAGCLVDSADLPVYSAYLERLAPLVRRVRTTSSG
jgi:hypothetical protein